MPGDEFPDFWLVGGRSEDDRLLLPEEKLESERQVRNRAGVGREPEKRPYKAKRRETW